MNKKWLASETTNSVLIEICCTTRSIVETRKEGSRDPWERNDAGRMIPRNRNENEDRSWNRLGQFVELRLAGCLTSVMGVDFSDETANGPVISTRNYHDSRDKGTRRPQTLALTSICKREKEEQLAGTSRRRITSIVTLSRFLYPTFGAKSWTSVTGRSSTML